MRYLKSVSTHPHENPDILHEPYSCEACDQYPERQQLRVAYGINFTGYEVKGLLPCPSTINLDKKATLKKCSTHGVYASQTDAECMRCAAEKAQEEAGEYNRTEDTLKKMLDTNQFGGTQYWKMPDWGGGITQGNTIMSYGNQISHYVGSRRYQHSTTEKCVHCQ